MLRVVQVGLGPLGRIVARDLVTRHLGRVVAAVDVAPDVAGRPLGDLVAGADGVTVKGSLADVADVPADAAIVTTSSDLRDCAPTFRALLERGLPVVSTCEELVWPWLRHRALADELAALARARGGRLAGAGVNPGYLMDALPAFATAPCRRVERVRVERIQDAATRRVPFQRKIGAGLPLGQHRADAAAGRIRHVGLGESLHLVAASLGWSVEAWDETIEPVVAEREIPCALGTIRPGFASGVRQVARGIVAGQERLRFEFCAAVGQPEPRDRVVVDGEPPIDLVIQGGVHGDVATSSLVLHALPALLAAAPGLHVPTTLPLLHWRSG